MNRLGGRFALVTGGGSGIGRAIAARLASEGAAVAVADLDRDAAEQTASTLREGGGEALAVQMDVADFARVTAVVSELRSSRGPIDILVNNAGWDRMQPFVENTPELWTRLIDVNLRGAIHCCRAVADDMMARGSGKIVSISSDAARVGSTGEAVYSACKGGIISFSKTLARELARYRINVNVVCPGPTDTPLLRGMAESGSAKLVDSLERAIPFRRLGRPEEIAAAVVFLVSPEASYVNGTVLTVDGGRTETI